MKQVSVYTDKLGVYQSLVDLSVLHYVSVCSVDCNDVFPPCTGLERVAGDVLHPAVV